MFLEGEREGGTVWQQASITVLVLKVEIAEYEEHAWAVI